MSEAPNKKITLSDVYYYFEGQARDHRDQGLRGRRNGELLAMRSRLLDLPEDQYHLAIKTLHNMLREGSARSSDPVEKRRQDANKLFAETAQAMSVGGGGGDKIDPV